ncbi:hypothetical protein FH972_002124 [Carpinus fangiana]|uniref:Uncharacterized protein n=1 Tax=Carpinus fangiana TaxID=176857 RepID=A0A5N6QDW2_9ROSI|nr:hypothetical protein FH972_002124 [Carpinus fangiana]
MTTTAASWSNPAIKSYSIYSRIICFIPNRTSPHHYYGNMEPIGSTQERKPTKQDYTMYHIQARQQSLPGSIHITGKRITGEDGATSYAEVLQSVASSSAMIRGTNNAARAPVGPRPPFHW